MEYRPFFESNYVLNEVSQTKRVLELFGGPDRLSRLYLEILGISTINHTPVVSEISRWSQEISRGGCGGFIPAEQWPTLLLLARIDGIVLTDDFFDPRPRKMYKILTIARQAVGRHDNASPSEDPLERAMEKAASENYWVTVHGQLRKKYCTKCDPPSKKPL